MTQKKVAIIGAGFSGLTLAWALTKQGFAVEIFESADRVGGLLGTAKDTIPVEKAANALLASASVEQLLADINAVPQVAGYRSKKRYIFRNKPTSFPISFLSAISGFSKILFLKLSDKLSPRNNETISEWCQRCLNKDFEQYLVSPALQGIYGTETNQLSAELILGGFFNKAIRPQKGNLRGSLSMSGGMQELVDKLVQYLKERNVVFHFSSFARTESFAATVIATSALRASSLVPEKYQKDFSTITMLPLTSVTMGFVNEKPLKGFGCLFPVKENFHSLGVLFNSDIFSGRGPLQSETWILNNTEYPVDLILKDRKRLTGLSESPQFFKITEYKKALPQYSLGLKKFLLSDIFHRVEEKSPFEVFKNGARLQDSFTYLTGNYLGGIGLTKILDYNIRLSERLKKDLT